MNNPVQSLAMARITTIALPVTLLLGAVSSPGLADGGERKVVVSHADLDLTATEGRAMLERRIDKAARTVCRIGFSRSVRIATETRKCIADVKKRLEPVRAEIVAAAQARSEGRGLANNQP